MSSSIAFLTMLARRVSFLQANFMEETLWLKEPKVEGCRKYLRSLVISKCIKGNVGDLIDHQYELFI